MKNAILLMGCGLVLALTTQAQPDLQGEYFFDADPGVGNGISLTIPTGPAPSLSTTLDITGLAPGVHLWYVRTKQNGVWGHYGQRRLFYLWEAGTVSPATDIEAAEYFFDSDPGAGNGTALAVTPGGSLNESALIDITGLTPGPHLWYVRAKQNGAWGFYGERKLFFAWDPADLLTASDIEAAEYFFDTDPGVGNGIVLPITPGASLNESAVIDITGLGAGVHLWYGRTKQNGVWGHYGERRLFYLWEAGAVSPPTDIDAAEYFFDTDPGPGNGTALAVTPGGALNESAVIDITGLPAGPHLWYVRTKQNGSWGFYGERKLFFIWDPAGLQTATDIEAAEFFIDNDPGVGNGSPITITPGASASGNALIDITGLATGPHQWNVRVKQNGSWGLYGDQREFSICPEDPDPAIIFAPSASCTSSTFTFDVTMPAGWSGDPFWVINNVNAQADTLSAGESFTFGPFNTGTELLFTSGSALDPNSCTKQYRAVLSCWYEDADNDGFGDPLSSVVAVDQPTGYVADDSDNCPTDPLKIDPGICGCGVEDIATTWYADTDNDGFGDPNDSQPGYTCIQPPDHVLDDSDDCPTVFGLIGDVCDDLNSYTINDTLDATCTCVGTPSTVVSVKLVLEGAYNDTIGLMIDSLRMLPSFPLMDPYPALGYVHSGPVNDGMVSTAILSVTGNDAIVDWVVVELRDEGSPTAVVASRSALVQRDGDVVELDGVSPIDFKIIGGNFYLAVRHRNHLGTMTLGTLALSPVNTVIDLTTLALSTYGSEGRKSISGAFPVQGLWSGDVNFDGTAKYTGFQNDRDRVLFAIGGTVATNSVTGYLPEDVNLDGKVKYTGSGNDRDPILVNIGGTVPTNTREGQLP